MRILGGQILLIGVTHDRYILLTDDRVFLVGGCIPGFEAQSIDEYMTSFLPFPLLSLRTHPTEIPFGPPEAKTFLCFQKMQQLP